MKNILMLALVFVFVACTGVTRINSERKTAQDATALNLYQQDFLKKINGIKEKVRQEKHEQALAELAAIKEEGLPPTSVATKENLAGVIYFATKKYGPAVKKFEAASLKAKEDPGLDAQVSLNLGSTYYKLSEQDKALSTLSSMNYRNLPDSEAKKYHQLYALLSQQQGKKEEALGSLIRLLEDKTTVKDVRGDARLPQIEEQYFKLSASERVRVLEGFDGEKNLAIPYLASKDAELSFRNGDQDKVEDFTKWIERRYGDQPEVMEVVKGLEVRNEKNASKINLRKVGVVLPLSGDLKALGDRALAGLDIALEEMGDNPAKKYQLEMRDTKGNPATGAFAVKELIETHSVSAVIGGLTSGEATKEYLEAKKFGVLFISLSKVLLPKEEKNHLLIEIPGSVESQVNHLFSNKMLEKIGRRPAIMYPKTEIGEAYANEFWRQAKKNNLDITGLISFDVTQADYRDPVKNILGIKFGREREEELSLVNDIAGMESKRRIKRIQNLQPQIDFDWVFVPALPRDVVQILPNFNYFDAFGLNYVGVPSWRSELMVNEGYRYGNVYFMDETIPGTETSFTQRFAQKFKKQPNIVETISYDSLKILSGLIESDSSFETRQDLDLALTKKGSLQSESGTWKLSDEVWLKDMGTFKIKREGVIAL